MSAAAPTMDLLLIGGGLANGLIAWRLRQRRPKVRLRLFERGAVLGGNHTWSFHDGDLDAAQRAWIEPLVAHRWPAYTVAFPACRRRLQGGYASISSERFDSVLRDALGEAVMLGAAAEPLSPTTARVDGQPIAAGAVIDGRGPTPSPHLALGHQIFLGQELRLTAPHGLDVPVLMDATIAQDRGYRFMYLLPLASDRLLIEDTCYADAPALDAAGLRAGIAAYAEAHGWRIAEMLREEQGVLPVVLSGDMEAFWDAAGGIPRAGLAAALFHPTTGYSLPDAVALADRIAALADLSAPSLFAAIRSHALAKWRRQGFFRLLNRMLFLAGEPAQRYRVMQRFYGLPERLIAHFYAGRLHALDKLRLVAGEPPVPVLGALRAIMASDLHRRRAS